MITPAQIDDPEVWRPVVARLRCCTSVMVMTGAGVSAESGLATFRAGGLWESHRFEDVATPEAFERDPELVWRFYNARRQQITSAQPNPAHVTIAQIQNRFGGKFTLATQNVDGLHQLAGSQNVLELHGSLRRIRCTGCGQTVEHLDPLPPLPRCACGGLQRPDVVWFGEDLPVHVLTQARSAAKRCRAMILVGTSAVVYPAAGLIKLARATGAYVIEVNADQTVASYLAHVLLRGNAGVMLPALLRQYLGE